MYDAMLGRTWQIDPHSDNFHDWSPYSWAGNNPLLNIDPDGQDWYTYTNDDGVETAVWKEGDAETIEIDGVTYTNSGTTYNQTLEDGSVVHYDQNEVTDVFDSEQTTGEALETEQDVQDFFGEDFEVEVVPERTNEVINEEIENFFWSWFTPEVRDAFGKEVDDSKTTAPLLIGPNRRSGGGKSKNPGYKEHTKGKRKSTKGKHEKGDRRRSQKHKDKKRNKKNWKPSK